MGWAYVLILVVAALAVGIGIGWESGYYYGQTDDVSESAFSRLTRHRHEWTEPFSATRTDGTRVMIRACLHCEAADEQTIAE